MSNYYEFRRDTLRAINGIGQYITEHGARGRIPRESIKRFDGKNMMTDERLCCLALAGPTGEGRIIAEVSMGYFIDHHIIGIAVFHCDPEHIDRDHDASVCCSTPYEAATALRQLNGESA